MQRLANLDKWFKVDADKALNFANNLPRRVRLDVNAPERTQLEYVDGNGEVTYLATVLGRDVIEFACGGEFSIIPNADCWFYTIDGEDTSFVIPDAVTLTKITTRRARNPELELMRVMMEQNVNRRMEALAIELEQSFNRRAAAAAVAPVQSAVEKPVASDSVKSESSKASVEPSKPAEGDAGNADGTAKAK